MSTTTTTTEVESTGTGEERSNSPTTNARCTFCFPCCFGSRRSATLVFPGWERVRSTSFSVPRYPSPGDRWWARGFMKVREWSEIAAGPRWKTFIRRFNRNRSGGGYRHDGKYQYDPLSYALNFDEGPGQNGDFDDESYGGFRSFSTRYVAAAAAAPSKSVTTDAVQDVAVFG